ncbi:MAG: TolC family protein [Chitinophagales bacterium]|nr:TolC family protein [Chitinophagales bacterium]
MKQVIFFFIVFLTKYTAFAQITELTLQQCVETAVQNNLQIRQGAAGVQLTGNAVQQSKLTLLPNLNFNSAYYVNYGKSIDYTTNLFVNGNFQSHTYSLSSYMTLYQGGIKGNTIKKTEFDYERSQLEQESLIENIKLYVVMGYLQVLFAEDQVRIAEQKKITSTQQLDNSKKIVQAGNLPEGNLLALEAQIAADEVGLVQAKNLVDLAYLDLKNLMQVEPTQQIKIVYADINAFENVMDTPIPEVQQVIDAALLTQPGIQKFKYQLESDALGVKIAQGDALPSLTVSGSVTTNYSDVTYIGFPEPDSYGDQLDNNLGEAIGLTLTVPIFNNGLVTLNKQNAELNYFNTEIAQQIAINDLKKSVTEAVTNSTAARASYDAALLSYNASLKAFEFEEKKFQAGQSNSLNYTIAANNLEQASITLSQAKYDYLFKRKVIDYYLGLPLNF